MYRIYRTDGTHSDHVEPEEITDRGAIAGVVFEDPIAAPDPRTRGRICLGQAEWYIWPVEFDHWYPLRSTHDLLIDWIMRRGPGSLRNAIKGETMMDRDWDALWHRMCNEDIPWCRYSKSGLHRKQELAKL